MLPSISFIGALLALLLLSGCNPRPTPAPPAPEPTTTSPANQPLTVTSTTAAPAAPSPPPATPAHFDTAGAANFMDVTLNAGFLPDPTRIEVVSGGAVAVTAETNGAAACTGYASVAPDVRLTWDGFGFLRFFFLAEQAADTGLVILPPSGEWLCSDDSFDTLAPTVDVADAAPGSYLIWVSSNTPDTYTAGALVITELDRFSPANPAGEAILVEQTVVPGDALNPDAAPLHDTVTLAEGFSPDPYPIPMQVGGRVDVVQAVGQSRCHGYASSAPSARVEWQGEGFLRFFFLPENGGDPALAIRDPQGTWFCMDDTYGTLNPSLDFLSSLPGTYEVWISAPAPGQIMEGTLYLTVWDHHPANYRP